MATATATQQLSPRQAAQLLGKSRVTVMRLIESGDLRARDERPPGSEKPRYRIDFAELDRWRDSRVVVSRARPQPLTVRVPGVLARRRMRRELAVAGAR
jgi:excisionase family DNA binding protein